MKKILFYIFLGIIIIYGIYLRFYELGTGSFWIDEGYSSIVSYFASINNYSPILPNLKYDFSQYLFTIFQNISFNFLGVNDFSARIPSFIFSILNLIVFYLFSKELLKNNKYKNIGILFLMFIFSFSTWQIIWSREARFYELLSTIYLSSTYFLYKFETYNQNKYFIFFLIISLVGIIFHPFCFGLIIIGFLILGYKIYKEKNFKEFDKIILLGIIIFIYFLIDLFIKYISIGNFEMKELIPNINKLGNYNFFNYFIFYIKSIYSELGIIFISYLFTQIYLVQKKKIYEFIIFGILVFINIVIISYGNLAHTRYMFHIYFIITLIGGYGIIILFSYINEFLNIKNKIIIILGLIFLLSLTIIKTYHLTIIPQRFYYIDYTSPKPNFKMAYNYIEENYSEYKIVSGFPHICYWYNLDKKSKCEKAINVNLIGDQNLNNNLEKKQKENYINLEYINSLKDIKNIQNYLFVMDDLTIKNAVNKKLINDIINNCIIIYKDVGDYEVSNFLGIWSCK